MYVELALAWPSGLEGLSLVLGRRTAAARTVFHRPTSEIFVLMLLWESALPRSRVAANRPLTVN